MHKMHSMLHLLLFILLSINSGRANVADEKNSCPHLWNYPSRTLNSRCYNSGNVNTSTPELIEHNNYDFEKHTVTTEDGYELDIFRVKKKGESEVPTRVVFMAHALFCNSDWFANTGVRSLAFNLVNRGNDVWLTNRRGTNYSRNDALTPYQFYNYTLDDLALKDTRALLKYVFKITGQACHYIGYSEGNTIVFMYGSQYPDEASKYIKKIYSIIAATYFDGVFSPTLELCPVLIAVHKVVGYPCLFYPTELILKLVMFVCTYLPHVCRFAINLLEGPTVQFRPDDLLNFFSRFPSKLSFGQCMHFYRIYKTGQLTKYDYGPEGNRIEYGTPKPPYYDLAKVTIDTVLFWGLNDNYQTKRSVERVRDELGSKYKKMVLIPPLYNHNCKPYNHIDPYMSETNEKCFYPSLFVEMD